MAKNKSYFHIFKYTGLFSIIQMVSVLASVFRNKAAALLIDRYGQGLADVFNNTITFVSTATTLVVPVAAVRRLSQIHESHGDDSKEMADEIKIIRSWSVLTGLFGMVLVMALCPLLSWVSFGHFSFTRSYLYLSPMLLLLSVNATEISILKATRQLKQLTIATGAGSVSTFVVCALSYYFFGLRGIVISLNAGLMCVMLLNMLFTLKKFPYKASPFKWSVLRKGGELIKLSISFMLASLVAALAEMLIRIYISNFGSIEDVGLYSAGFALSVTYTKFIFQAMDADFYPRLSAIINNIKQMNTIINRQIVVSVLIIVPCLLLFCLFLPQIVSLLYTDKYHEAIPMVICATFFVFNKAVLTPVAYTSLAKGDAKIFFIIESVSALLLGACVISGYALCGLTGAGIGLTVSNFVELVIIFIVYSHTYKVKLNTHTICVIFTELVVLSAGIAVIEFLGDNYIKYGVVILLALLAAIACLYYCFLKSDKEAE